MPSDLNLRESNKLARASLYRNLLALPSTLAEIDKLIVDFATLLPKQIQQKRLDILYNDRDRRFMGPVRAQQMKELIRTLYLNEDLMQEVNRSIGEGTIVTDDVRVRFLLEKDNRNLLHTVWSKISTASPSATDIITGRDPSHTFPLSTMEQAASASAARVAAEGAPKDHSSGKSPPENDSHSGSDHSSRKRPPEESEEDEEEETVSELDVSWKSDDAKADELLQELDNIMVKNMEQKIDRLKKQEAQKKSRNDEDRQRWDRLKQAWKTLQEKTKKVTEDQKDYAEDQKAYAEDQKAYAEDQKASADIFAQNLKVDHEELETLLLTMGGLINAEDGEHIMGNNGEV